MNQNNQTHSIDKQELIRLLNDFEKLMISKRMEMTLSSIECYIEEKSGKIITITDSLLYELGYKENTVRLTQSLSVNEQAITRYVNEMKRKSNENGKSNVLYIDEVGIQIDFNFYSTARTVRKQNQKMIITRIGREMKGSKGLLCVNDNEEIVSLFEGRNDGKLIHQYFTKNDFRDWLTMTIFKYIKEKSQNETSKKWTIMLPKYFITLFDGIQCQNVEFVFTEEEYQNEINKATIVINKAMHTCLKKDSIFSHETKATQMNILIGYIKQLHEQIQSNQNSQHHSQHNYSNSQQNNHDNINTNNQNRDKTYSENFDLFEPLQFPRLSNPSNQNNDLYMSQMAQSLLNTPNYNNYQDSESVQTEQVQEFLLFKDELTKEQLIQFFQYLTYKENLGEAYSTHSLSYFFFNHFNVSITPKRIEEEIKNLNFIEMEVKKQSVPIDFNKKVINETYDRFYDFEDIEREWIFTFDLFDFRLFEASDEKVIVNKNKTFSMDDKYYIINRDISTSTIGVCIGGNNDLLPLLCSVNNNDMKSYIESEDHDINCSCGHDYITEQMIINYLQTTVLSFITNRISQMKYKGKTILIVPISFKSLIQSQQTLLQDYSKQQIEFVFLRDTIFEYTPLGY